MLTRGCERPRDTSVDDSISPHLVSSRSLTDSVQYRRLASADSSSNSDDCSFHSFLPVCKEIKTLDHADSLNIQSPIIFRNMSCEETSQSAFTPIRKRNRTPDISPVCIKDYIWCIGFFVKKIFALWFFNRVISIYISKYFFIAWRLFSLCSCLICRWSDSINYKWRSCCVRRIVFISVLY